MNVSPKCQFEVLLISAISIFRFGFVDTNAKVNNDLFILGILTFVRILKIFLSTVQYFSIVCINQKKIVSVIDRKSNGEITLAMEKCNLTVFVLKKKIKLFFFVNPHTVPRGNKTPQHSYSKKYALKKYSYDCTRNPLHEVGIVSV